MENKYKHILIDLDQTLWDFRRNSLEVIQRLYDELKLEKKGVSSFKDFINTYKEVNTGLWEEYRHGRVDKITLNNARFINTLKKFTDDMQAEITGKEMAELYVKYSPQNITLFDDVEDVLEYLAGKYDLHVISNGFSEIQMPKLKNSGLYKYFKNIILSEETGCLKPDIRFFNYALEKAGAVIKDCVVIGDDPEADVLGANNAGINVIWFKHDNHTDTNDVEATQVISSLLELKDIL